MIIDLRIRVARATLLKRFPVPRNFGVARSRASTEGGHGRRRGRHDARQVFEIYRYDPDLAGNPRLDTFEVDLDDCGPMVLDALFWIKDHVDSTLTFRRSCREGVCGSCAMNIDGTNWLACTRFISDLDAPATIYPQANKEWIVKDLVCDLTHVFAQYGDDRAMASLQDTEPEKERLHRRAIAASSMATTSVFCFCCTSGCPSHWWNGDRFLGPAALLQAGRWLADSRDEATGERLDILEDPFRLYRCHHPQLHPDLPEGVEPGKGAIRN